MDQSSLRIDPDAARSSITHLRNLAEDADLTAAALRATIAQVGECWGTDRPGRTFSEHYLPGAEEASRALADLVAELEEFGSGVAQAVDVLGAADDLGGYAIRQADRATDHLGPDPVGSPIDRDVSMPSNPNTMPAAEIAFDDPARADGTGRLPTPTAHGISEANDGPPARTPFGLDDHRSVGSDSSKPPPQHPKSDTPASNSLPTDAMGSTPFSAATGHVSGSGPATAERNVSTNTSAPTGMRAISTPPRHGPAQLPWLRDSHRTPWSGSTSGSPGHAGTPPRMATPQAPGTRTGPGATRSRPGNATHRRNPAATAPNWTDTEAVRLVKAVALRHGFDLAGIETAGLGLPAARALATALDSALSRHTVALSGLEITTPRISADPVHARPRARDARTPGNPGWITLERTVLTDDTARSGALATSVLRRLGHLLDEMTGFVAHSRAQRMLIADYRRGHDWRGLPLGRVVADYKRWRGRLNSYCFDGGRLDPGAALADSFAEVILHGDQAPEPARALHRLLRTAATLGSDRPQAAL